MNEKLISMRSFCILNGLGGVVGVVLISVSFNINPGPPAGASSAELIKFGQQHYASVLWGAWLQAVGPVLIVLFAFSLVHLAGATQRLSAWMTFFGATTLMAVSLIEITFYISALYPDPAMMPFIEPQTDFCGSASLLHSRRSSSVLALGHCSCRFAYTPSFLRVSGAPAGNCFRSARSRFSAEVDAACRSHGVRRSPSVLVVGSRYHADDPKRKNREQSGSQRCGYHRRASLNNTENNRRLRRAIQRGVQSR